MTLTVHQKTIQPTKLQPKLFSLIKELSEQNDYRIIVDRNSQPICIMMNFALVQDIDLELLRSKKVSTSLADEMKNYYSSLSTDETNLKNSPIDDIQD